MATTVQKMAETVELNTSSVEKYFLYDFHDIITTGKV